MQVQKISSEGLRHEFKVTIPHSTLNENMVQRLNEIGKTAKIEGFRPGKAPLTILKQRFGMRVRSEVLDETVSKSVQKTLTDNNLRPAMEPKIELVNFAEDKDLEYKMSVETLPEITPMDFGKLTLEKPVAEVAEATINEAITRAAKSMREPELVTETRPAKMGDVLVIDFDGSVDGKAFPGMKSENHSLELGTKSFIDNFEEQLVGSKVGDAKDITVKFPDEYHAAHLSGKTAVFKVNVKELRAPKPVEMNDELAKELGLESLETLRKRIADDIGANYAGISRAVIKRRLMDQLADAHDFTVPAGLVEHEFNSIWQQIEQDKAKGELPPDEAAKSVDELKADYQKIAERRVKLGLLLADVGRKQKLEVSQGELSQAMMAEARRYPGQEKAVFDYFTKTEGAIERLRAPLLEDKVVDYIVSQAKVTEKKVSAEELMKLPDAED